MQLPAVWVHFQLLMLCMLGLEQGVEGLAAQEGLTGGRSCPCNVSLEEGVDAGYGAYGRQGLVGLLRQGRKKFPACL